MHVKAAHPTVSLRVPSPKVRCQWPALLSAEATRHPPVWERSLSAVLPVSPIALLYPSTQPLQWKKPHIQSCLQRSFRAQSRSWMNLWLFRNKEQWISLHGANIFLSNLRAGGRFSPDDSSSSETIPIQFRFYKIENHILSQPRCPPESRVCMGGAEMPCKPPWEHPQPQQGGSLRHPRSELTQATASRNTSVTSRTWAGLDQSLTRHTSPHRHFFWLLLQNKYLWKSAFT